MIMKNITLGVCILLAMLSLAAVITACKTTEVNPEDRLDRYGKGVRHDKGS